MVTFEDELLSVKQLAEHSGEHQVTWLKRLASGALPIVKISSAIRVRRSDYESWLTERMETRTPKSKLVKIEVSHE
jgi:hypothetical protein